MEKGNRIEGSEASPAEAALVTIEGPGPLAPIPGPIDWSRPVHTRSRKVPVHIYAIDHGLAFPVIGKRQGDDEVTCWGYDGKFREDKAESGLDLENVPHPPATSQEGA